jgi:anti-anti-sigma regulatory factor
MLKITSIEEPTQYRLVVEGKLIAPWISELKSACDRARTGLNGRKLVVDLQCLTFISQDGEKILLELMNDGTEICGSGLFTKHILRQLTRRRRRNLPEENR